METAERREVRREVFRLAWPVVLQNITRTTMFIADSVMLGNFHPSAIASVGIAGPFVYTFVAVTTSLAVGTMAVVARAVGEKDAAKQERHAITALAAAAIAGIILAALALATLDGVIRIFEVEGSPDVMANAVAYLSTITWAFPFILVEIVASSVLRAAGNSKIPMLIAVGANLLNIGLNYLLIYGELGLPGMGVRGAAAASVIAYGLQTTVVVLILFSRRSPIPLRLGSFRFVNRDSFAKLARVTIPAAIEPMILQGGLLVVVKYITVLGAASLAAHRAAIAVESLSFMPCYGLAIACSAVVGQSLGAGNIRRAELGLQESARISLWFMSSLGILFFAVPSFLMGLFVPGEPDVIMLGAACLAISAFEQPFMGLTMVYGGALRGAGDTRSPVYVGIVGFWLIRIPISYLFAFTFGWGIIGIWMVMVLDWLARTIVFMVLYKRGRWKTITL